MRLEFGVDGLREAGFHEADGATAFDAEISFQIGGQKILHDGIVPEILQHFLAMFGRDVFGDEHEMQFALVPVQAFAAHDQNARALHKGE